MPERSQRSAPAVRMRAAATSTDSPNLNLRITVDQPPPGVAFGIQIGKDRFELPRPGSKGALLFEFSVRLGPGAGPPRLLGPAVQGPPAARFVYITSGKRAGQPDSFYDRRAKIPLAGISRALIKKHLEARGSRLEFRMAGSGRGGGPTCGSVRPADEDDWRIVPR